MFKALVDYHCSVNLKQAVPHIQNGVLDNRSGLIPEGSDVSCPYSGLLIVANGSTLANRLLEDHIVNDDEIGEFEPVPRKEELFRYIQQLIQEDGAYVFDGTQSRMTHVQELNNNPASLSSDFEIYGMVPNNFFYASSNGPRPRIGTKTRLAIKLPHAYDDTETFQIKRSRYGSLGMGKVTHFTKQGLAEEFLFDYDPKLVKGSSNPQAGLVGIIRTYQSNHSRLHLATEDKVNLDQH